MNSLRLLSSKAGVFLKRQEWDWKITVLRTSLDRFAYQIVFPYLSLYIVALGATATELGFVNSLGMVVGGMDVVDVVVNTRHWPARTART